MVDGERELLNVGMHRCHSGCSSDRLLFHLSSLGRSTVYLESCSWLSCTNHSFFSQREYRIHTALYIFRLSLEKAAHLTAETCSLESPERPAEWSRWPQCIETMRFVPEALDKPASSSEARKTTVCHCANLATLDTSRIFLSAIHS